MKNIIQQATSADIDQIMGLERLGFPPGIVERTDTFEERINNYPQGFLVIKNPDADILVGYICSEIWERKDPIDPDMFLLDHSIGDLHTREGDELYISSMTIHPHFRRHGLGRIVFRECIARQKALSPRISSLILIVNEVWHHARKIYQEQGLIERFVIPGFFHPTGHRPQDAIVMRGRI